jgi:hypothetical protein
MSLPVKKMDPPKPAYVLNCTFHLLDVPGWSIGAATK